jgi:S1-C subfamily serine protease
MLDPQDPRQQRQHERGALGVELGVAVEQGDQGLVVADASGPAARAGVQPGDVILAVNNQPVKSVEQLRQAVDKAGKHVALLVQREDARVYVPIDLG